MNLGTFWASLTVKDIEAFDDHEEDHRITMSSGTTLIGLFQEVFDNDVLTFNSEDGRAIQKGLKSREISDDSEAEESTTGPASWFLKDPVGHPIFFDEHDPDYKPTSVQ